MYLVPLYREFKDNSNINLKRKYLVYITVRIPPWRDFEFICKKKKEKKKDQLLRAPSVGTGQFDASRRRKKELKSSRDKNARHEPQWVGGEKSLLCDPGSELRLGGREQRGRDNNWDGNCLLYTSPSPRD